MPSLPEEQGRTETSGAFRTTATVVVPSFLSYCLAVSEAHYEALCDTYVSVSDALRPMETSRVGQDGNYYASHRASASVLICDLDDDEYASSLLQYQPFHLDFGPLTWMACTKLLAHLRATYLRLSSPRAPGSSTTEAELRGTSDYAFELPRDTSTGDDDGGGATGIPIEGLKAPMLLVVIRVYLGIEHATNLLTALGVMAVISNALTHASQALVTFPLEVAWQWTTAFHDASPYDDAEAFFDLTGPDVVLAALKGYQLWKETMLDTDRFLVAHDYFQRMEHGDISWIVPWRFSAFPSPADEAKSLAAARPRGAGHEFAVPDEDDVALQMITKPASYYAATFADPRGFYGCVHTVIQLNDNVRYRVSEFTERGISHESLCFMDGSVPSDYVIAEFFRIVDQQGLDHQPRAPSSVSSRPKTAIAVHCMAGLGRTGTLIALALMRDYGFSAKEAIGWCRLCRPGCIIGPQQQFLCWTESRWKRLLFSAPRTARRDGSRREEDAVVEDDGDVANAVRRDSSHRTAAPPYNEPRPRGGFYTGGIGAASFSQPSGADIDIDRSSLVEVVVNRVLSSNASTATTGDRPNPEVGRPAAGNATTTRLEARRTDFPVQSTSAPFLGARGAAPLDLPIARLSTNRPNSASHDDPVRLDAPAAPQGRLTQRAARTSRRGTATYTVGRSVSPASRRRRQQSAAREDWRTVTLPQGVQSWLDDNARWMREQRTGGDARADEVVPLRTIRAAAPARATMPLVSTWSSSTVDAHRETRPFSSDVPVKTVLDALSPTTMSPHPSSPRAPMISRVSVIL